MCYTWGFNCRKYWWLDCGKNISRKNVCNQKCDEKYHEQCNENVSYMEIELRKILRIGLWKKYVTKKCLRYYYFLLLILCLLICKCVTFNVTFWDNKCGIFRELSYWFGNRLRVNAVYEAWFRGPIRFLKFVYFSRKVENMFGISSHILLSYYYI